MKTRLITLVFSAFFCLTLCLYSNFFVGRVMEKVTQDAKQMEKLLAEGVIQSLREKKPISWANIARVCELLNCQPGDIIEYISDIEE